MYRVSLADHARGFFEAADAPLQRRLDRCFDQLKVTPRRHNNVKALRGNRAGSFRYRVGDWRVIYRIEESEQVVVVTDIAHRREVYE